VHGGLPQVVVQFEIIDIFVIIGEKIINCIILRNVVNLPFLQIK